MRAFGPLTIAQPKIAEHPLRYLALRTFLWADSFRDRPSRIRPNHLSRLIRHPQPLLNQRESFVTTFSIFAYTRNARLAEAFEPVGEFRGSGPASSPPVLIQIF